MAEKLRSSSGFSLVEILITIVIIGFFVPVCILNFVKVMQGSKNTEGFLDGEVAVTGKLEELLATGVPCDTVAGAGTRRELEDGLLVTYEKENAEDHFYRVTVSYPDPLTYPGGLTADPGGAVETIVSVGTTIRENPPDAPDEGGGGG